MTTKGSPTKKNDTTLLVLVIDRSGSMETIREDMEGGIKTLLAEQATEPGQCLVTLAQFDTEYEILFDGVPVAELGDYRLVPRGSTALLDAMGRTISTVRERLKSLPKEKRPANVIFAVVTDGLENSSHEWTRDTVMAAVKDRIDAGWHFTFLGANQDAIQEGERLGVDRNASMTFAASAAGSRGAMRSMSASIGRVRRGEAARLDYTDDERGQATGL
jgi:Mg-chelatase subunit ChlD